MRSPIEAVIQVLLTSKGSQAIVELVANLPAVCKRRALMVLVLTYRVLPPSAESDVQSRSSRRCQSRQSGVSCRAPSTTHETLKLSKGKRLQIDMLVGVQPCFCWPSMGRRLNMYAQQGRWQWLSRLPWVVMAS